MKRKSGVAGVFVMAAGMLAAEAVAGPEKNRFPAGFEKWEMYTSLDRPDLKQYRELYARPEVVKAVPEGKPNEKANAGIDACFNCHKLHEKQDYVISLARPAGTFQTGPVATRSGPTDVNITSFSFGPSTIRIALGQAVTWTNADELPHQVSVVGKLMKTAVLLREQSASLKFDEAGTFGYICALHPNLKGTVEVTK